jgi:hypothetical protein
VSETATAFLLLHKLAVEQADGELQGLRSLLLFALSNATDFSASCPPWSE